jgi:hypothetical protein
MLLGTTPRFLYFHSVASMMTMQSCILMTMVVAMSTTFFKKKVTNYGLSSKTKEDGIQKILFCNEVIIDLVFMRKWDEKGW